jgi:hypothetical protein
MAVADFDGDGRVDVVVGCSGSGTLNFFRNTSTPGTISFAPVVVNPAANVGQVIVSDLNADQLPDLLLNNNGSVVFLQNASSPGTISLFAIGSITRAIRGVGRLATKAALPLAVGMTAYDAYKGFTADPNASMSERFSNAGSSAIDTNLFEMEIFNRALSVQEIQKLYQSSLRALTATL